MCAINPQIPTCVKCNAVLSAKEGVDTPQGWFCDECYELDKETRREALRILKAMSKEAREVFFDKKYNMLFMVI